MLRYNNKLWKMRQEPFHIMLYRLLHEAMLRNSTTVVNHHRNSMWISPQTAWSKIYSSSHWLLHQAGRNYTDEGSIRMQSCQTLRRQFGVQLCTTNATTLWQRLSIDVQFFHGVCHIPITENKVKAAYSPQGNGQEKRINLTILPSLRSDVEDHPHHWNF